MEQKNEMTLKKRMVQVLVSDPEPMMYHGEVVLRDGVPVGDVRTASYGHTLGGAIGLSMVERLDDGSMTLSGKKKGVTKKWLDSGEWEVDIAGVRYPCTVSLRPMYDPTNAKIKM